MNKRKQESACTADELWQRINEILKLARDDKMRLYDVIKSKINKAENKVPEFQRCFVARDLKTWADVISRLCLPNDYSARKAIAEIVPQASPNN